MSQLNYVTIGGSLAGRRGTVKESSSGNGIDPTNYRHASIDMTSVVQYPSQDSPRGTPFSRWGLSYKGKHELIGGQVDAYPHSILRNESNAMAFKNLSKGSYQLGTEIAEVYSTAKTIQSTVSNILKIALDAKRAITSARARERLKRRFGSGFSPDKVEDAWMAARFGIRPLVYSFQDIHSLAVSSLNKPLLLRAYGTASGSNTYPDRRITQTVWTGLALEVKNPEALARSQLGFGSDDVIPLLWEMTPFSWAVDYFFNIGDYLGSLSTPQGTVPRYSYISCKNEVRISKHDTIRWASYSKPGFRKMDVNNILFSRSARNEFPSLNVTFSPDLDVAKTADLVVLLRQLMR